VAIINQGRLLAIDSPAGLQRASEQANSVRLEITAPAESLRDALLAIDGVRGAIVRPMPGSDVIQTVDCQVDANEGIEARIARAVASRWDLHRLERQQPTLENIFLRYVGGTAQGQAA
jgi:ABC-type multidrug transport system ATPase subunit